MDRSGAWCLHRGGWLTKCREVEGIICKLVLLKASCGCEPPFEVLVIRVVGSRLGNSVLNRWVQSMTEFDYDDDGVDVE